jgi:hypothetical protein
VFGVSIASRLDIKAAIDERYGKWTVPEPRSPSRGRFHGFRPSADPMHLTGTGSQNVKLARKIKEVAASLTFTYALIPRTNQREVESFLIASLGTARLANMRREGLYEEQLQD